MTPFQLLFNRSSLTALDMLVLQMDDGHMRPQQFYRKPQTQHAGGGGGAEETPRGQRGNTAVSQRGDIEAFRGGECGRGRRRPCAAER